MPCMKRLFACCLLAAFSLVAQTPKRGSVLLEEHTASNSATLNFTSWYSSAYDAYDIEFISVVPFVNDVPLNINFSTNGGSTYDASTVYDNAATFTFGSRTGTYNTVNQTAFTPFGVDVASTTGYAAHGTIRLSDPASGNYKMLYTTNLQFNASVALPLVLVGYGIYRNTAAVNAFQISAGTGNLTSGTVRIYGLTH
jgi:hypothetical protein